MRKVSFAKGAGEVTLSGGRATVMLAGESLGLLTRLTSGQWIHGRDRSRRFSSPEAAAEDLAAMSRGEINAMTKRQIADALIAIEIEAGRLERDPGAIKALFRRLFSRSRADLATQLQGHRDATAAAPHA